MKTAISVAAIALVSIIVTPNSASADEGGISFWLPGTFGSLAAIPQQPGWSQAVTYYHTSVSAGGDVVRAREITIGNLPVNVTANVNANINANVNLGLFTTSYVFESPVLGGQASVGLTGIYGANSTSLAGSLTGTLALPGGGVIPFARTDNIFSSVAIFPSAPIPPPVSPTSASDTARSTPAAATLTSIRRPGMNCQPCSG